MAGCYQGGFLPVKGQLFVSFGLGATSAAGQPGNPMRGSGQDRPAQHGPGANSRASEKGEPFSIGQDVLIVGHRVHVVAGFAGVCTRQS